MMARIGTVVFSFLFCALASLGAWARLATRFFTASGMRSDTGMAALCITNEIRNANPARWAGQAAAARLRWARETA